MTPARRQDVESFPTLLFRRRFLYLQDRDGLTLNDVANYLGWMRRGDSHKGKEYPDSTRIARVLGMREYASGTNGEPLWRETVDYDLAVRLCDALSMDYYEVGV